MVFFDFGVIGQHADGVEIVPAATLVGREEFLHRVGGVRAVVQNLRQRGVSRSRSRERIAQRFRFLGGRFALFTQTRDASLQRGRLLLQRAMLRVGRFPVKGRTFSVVANLNRRLQQRGFAGLELLQRRRLVHQRFFRLLLLAVQSQQALPRLGRALA